MIRPILEQFPRSRVTAHVTTDVIEHVTPPLDFLSNDVITSYAVKIQRPSKNVPKPHVTK